MKNRYGCLVNIEIHDMQCTEQNQTLLERLLDIFLFKDLCVVGVDEPRFMEFSPLVLSGVALHQ